MNIKKGNKLIADFIGLEYLGYNYLDFNGYVYDCTKLSNTIRNVVIKNTPLLYCNTQSMHFHTSFDWLLPIVNKIKANKKFKKKVTKALLANDIDKTYKTIIKYIKL
jgi:hypothetical protein